MACEKKTNGTNCSEIKDTTCTPFNLSDIDKKRDSCFIDGVVNESLNIGGADLLIFKLLGVHEQGKLVDLTGNGSSISGGSELVFPSDNAFSSFVTEWRSIQKGSAVLASTYIGYDFGDIKLENDRLRYSVDTSIKHNIATLKIKQSSDGTKRASKIRVERSDDNTIWYGAAIVILPDDDVLNTIHFKHTVPSRYWRIRPLEFDGGPNDSWNIQALQLMDYDETSIDDIQDDIFMENRDRDYASESITLKGTYDLIDITTELTRFGIELPSQSYYMHIAFNQCVAKLGRPLVIGDVMEVPSEVQYNVNMEPIKKYLEITDVGWSTEGYTPGWQPTLLRIIAQPMFASQETQDIFGGLAGSIDSSGLFDIDDGQHPVYQDVSQASQAIGAEETINGPERGSDIADIHEFTAEDIQSAKDQGLPNLEKLNINATGLYVEDAMPPNGEDYTESDTYPPSASNGDYHRLTYSGLADDVPPRLFRYSVAKNRWIYLETDRRREYRTTKPLLQEFLSSPTNKPAGDISK